MLQHHRFRKSAYQAEVGSEKLCINIYFDTLYFCFYTSEVNLRNRESKKSGSGDCAHMQLRAARSLWMKFLLLRYSIPRAMSVMNFTSICDGRYCRTKKEISVTHPTRAVVYFLHSRGHYSSSLQPELSAPCSRY